MAKNKNKKFRISAVSPSKGLTLSAPQTTEERPDDLCPVFSFEYMAKGYSVEDLEKDDQSALVIQLFKLTQLAWKNIFQAHRHGLGSEKIHREAIKVAIPPKITPDVNFIAFRFSGKKSMVGFRRGRIFFIVWLDRNFTVYNHG